ncbi:hypothetical protein AU374_00987 [Cupriavidus metallidurans]|jgi:hypothetical protein|uniref:zonular occludens toxin domain-containing protein n=1 Tax=Cupriavidus metallidurans TaxID=119219 RepID=UPI0007638335|nr:zonular occludens toxin domain-containing protein [Cupriavidus metallidurans]KWW38201.1 hypothetical protein AU374_00987 [Cupriavidus metallidurans]
MANWGVTGKLGGGKTLWAMFKAAQYVGEGRRVVSNIDIDATPICKPWRDQNMVRVQRIPYRPTRAHLDQIGRGNESKDESKNGLLILDECGAILNSRNYKDQGRDQLIEWFLHARHLGWDVMFIVQSLTLIDKQIREALVEYKVVCKRLDRMNWPFIGWLGLKVPMPRVHFALIKYGLEAHAATAERDFFRGSHLYAMYNTHQLHYEEGDIVGPFSYLTPWHLKGRHMTKSQIIKYCGKSALVMGLVLGAIFTWASLYGLGYRAPVKGPAGQQEAAAIADLTGAVIHDDHTILVTDKTGKSYSLPAFRRTGTHVYVQLPDGKTHSFEMQP